jgi:hypothetical protein
MSEAEADVTDAMPEEAVTFDALPFECLVSIGSTIMPSSGFAAPSAEWIAAVHFIATSHLTNAAMREAMSERVQLADDPSPSSLCSLVRSLLLGGGATKWKAVSPLRAVRAQTRFTAQVHAPPRLSGGSFCALAPRRLCLFGGRDSLSGDTSSSTYLVTMRSPVAIWDQLVCDTHPAARCYHTAVVWQDAPRARTDLPPMIVFGGAGDGDGGHENLLDDVWSASMPLSAASSQVQSASSSASTSPPLSWRRLAPGGTAPTARSSHICAGWPAKRALLIHGGLSTEGVLGDTWLLRPCGTADDGCEWAELNTSGAPTQRAHHSGGLGGEETRLVFSGQVRRDLI